ncbi:MAG: 23S rRNA (guanosine(2251)-2'-O)-methyltransferase RlmB, partial [Bacteroidales bacterium]|nr:23S rRNA (guanosine(2251)-2'-O)-methyltransferase RlmB [Bacteroidales bacterium]
GSAPYTVISYKEPTAFILGSEEDGVSPEYLKLCDDRARIPMLGRIESLNVSVANGILLYEALRQRGQ